MSEIDQQSKQSVEINREINTSTETEVVRKRVTPDATEEYAPDDPRRPKRVDRTEVKDESNSGVAEESESVRRLVTPDLTEELDPDDPRRPKRVDRTQCKTEDVTDSDEG